MKSKQPSQAPVKAVIYARYSSHMQTEQSIEGQLRDNYEWAERNGVTVIAEYIDRALSGTSDQRPEFQRMIEDAAKRQFTLIIVWKLDRFTRNRYDSAIYKTRLKKYGVRVVSVKENISDNPEGIILEGLLESMAEYYSANLAQNIRRGKRETAAKGMFGGGPIPYGYTLSNGRLVVDAKSAEAIRYLFEQYAQGARKKDIIDELNRRGFRAASGKPLNSMSFARALKNPAYIGQCMYNGILLPDLADRIIDDDTFEKVQQRLKQNARAPGANKAREEYILRGKLFCGQCGANMLGDSGRATGKQYYRYYRCAQRKNSRTCDKKSERKDFIEWYVVEQTVEYILTPARAELVAAAVVREYEKEFSDTRIAEINNALRAIDRELDKLIDAIVKTPEVAHEKIYDRMKVLESQKIELETDLARLRIANRITLTKPEVLAWLKTFCKGDPLDAEFRKRIIDVFINSVYLYDDRVIVFYNIRGGKQISYIDLINPNDLPAEELPTDNPPIENPNTPSDFSDLNTHVCTYASKSEPRYVFVNGIFGCIFYRQRDKE